ncbi:conjugal transfer protein TraF [Marinimicrobium sp. C2-29]|uniref:conjugal transfer protein TraF n=1 Tax=Marinimicrobium sp. C2-29 TaxID=3139825 RepID=UPI003139B6B0
MRKTLLSLALVAASGSVAASDYFNGRLTGMSGAGYATGGYADGVVFNPSLGAGFGERDDFALVANLGVLGEDEDELVDGLEDLSDYLTELEETTAYDVFDEVGGFDPNNPDQFERDVRALQQEQADEAIARLEAVANKTANVGPGGSLVLSIPNNWLSLSLVGKVRGEAAVRSVVDENDYQVIRDAVGETNFDPSVLQSYGVGRGAVVAEGGLAMAKSLKTGEDSKLLLGVTPKLMHVTTFVYTATVDSFEEDDFDADDYSIDNTDANVDLGATYISGNMRYALTVNNAISRSYETIEPGDHIEIKPRATTALGYKSDWFTAEGAVDLNTSPNFATGQETQYARAGIELNAWQWVQVRAGYRMDLEDNIGDTYSVGLGLSPFNVVNLDIAAFSGEGNTMGASAQLGLRF